MINALLIANRGEIACRIIRTCRKLGIRAIAVYSEADRTARHVLLADEAVYLGPAPAGQSYLNIEAIISAAQRTQADAIHPGYGFLAENAPFARACQTAGLIFIGPSAEAIETMGNKGEAKTLVAKMGAPVAPGYQGSDQTEATFMAEADKIGYPIMVKATAGGGGKGMRLVERADELLPALASARREAEQAFGSAQLLLERAIINPRHVEVQIFGDAHGNIIHLGERDCSIQRRHQKIIEESPAPGLTPALREALGQAAVSAGRAVNYTNAGTVEFLLAEDNQFYFLEMNTRLQVEHPVTEMVTGLDLVEWQILIAEGEPLPLTQEDVSLNGHAIEARLYAENPANDFLPVTGPVLLWQEAAGQGVRVDGALQTGDEISVYYDPLTAKIIAYGPTRPAALRRLNRALETTILLGFKHNLTFLRQLIAQPDFQAGEIDTGFIARHFSQWTEPGPDVSPALIAVSLAQWLAAPGPYWRNNPNRPALYRYQLEGDATPCEVQLSPSAENEGAFEVTLSSALDSVFQVTVEAKTEYSLTLSINGHRQTVFVARQAETWWTQSRNGIVTGQNISLLPIPAPSADAGGSLRAPMPGSVTAVLVAVGQKVEKGETLLKLEAMKMEHTIRAAAPGTVEAIYFAPGDQVEADALLLSIKGD